MEIVIVESAAHAAMITADAIERLLIATPRPTLGLATGSSPLPTYRELIERYQRGQVSFASAKAYLLDEYVGLAADHPESYRSFIQREFTSRIDLPSDALFGPDGSTPDLSSAADRYEQLLAESGGIDIQLLGLGSDGHIGFNEPTSSLGSRSRIKTLTEETRTANARFFDDDVDAVPRHALTQGVGTILDARHLILIASGAEKAEAVALAVEGPLAARHPASALQLHPHVTFIVDEPAAGGLTQSPYYRETFAGKPGWQHI